VTSANKFRVSTFLAASHYVSEHVGLVLEPSGVSVAANSTSPILRSCGHAGHVWQDPRPTGWLGHCFARMAIVGRASFEFSGIGTHPAHRLRSTRGRLTGRPIDSHTVVVLSTWNRLNRESPPLDSPASKQVHHEP
jgi:hypothetical protein